MKQSLEDSIKIITGIIGSGKLREDENLKLMAVLGLLQGLLIIESIK